MAGAKPKVTDAQIKAAIEKRAGVLAAVARQLKISRQALWKRTNASPELKQAIADAREALVDDAESALQEAIKKKEPWAVRLVLLTLGKNRGYSRAVEVSGTVNATGVVHVLELPDNGRGKRS